MANPNVSCISTPSIQINSIGLLIVPNSFMYTEGFGEQDVKAQSGGGGTVVPIVIRDVSTALSRCSFQVYPTEANIDLLRQIKSNFDALNAIAFFDNNSGFNRTIQNAVLTNDYEVNLGADTPISLEFKGSQAV